MLRKDALAGEASNLEDIKRKLEGIMCKAYITPVTPFADWLAQQGLPVTPKNLQGRNGGMQLPHAGAVQHAYLPLRRVLASWRRGDEVFLAGFA